MAPAFAKNNKPNQEGPAEKLKAIDSKPKSEGPQKTKVKIEAGTLKGIKSGYEKFLDGVKKGDSSKPAVETENGKENAKNAKDSENKEHEEDLKKAKLETDVKKMDNKGSGVDLEKIEKLDKKKKEKKSISAKLPDGESMKIEKVKDKLSKNLDKESGDDKDKVTIKKADDRVGEELQKAEEGEKSDHDKKIDEKKEAFSKNVKDIMKGIRDTP